MNANKNITANFSMKAFTLNINAANGTVSKNPNLSAYDSSSTVQLTATPATGYHFTSWSGDVTGTTNPVTVTMDANKNITANFAINTYTLTVNATNGSVAKNPNLAAYDSNSTVQLTATPATGYQFIGWSGDLSGSANPVTVTMNANKNITANFSMKAFTLNINAANGTVSKNPNLSAYDSNSTVQLTATPATGYHFTSWSGDVTGTTNPVTVTMDANKNITANFAINTYTLTVNAANGSVAQNPNLAAYDSNSTVQLTATPALNYHFTGWSGDLSGSANPATVTMNASKNITANFAIDTYTLTATATNGTITKNPDQASYDVNTVVQLTATPATGYHFTGWSGDLTGSTNPVTVTMNANKNITANFAINTYTLTVTAPNGSVIKSPNQALYDSNTTVQLTAVPATGYHFTSWSGDVTGTTNPATVTMDANKNITANFAINTFTLTATATNGTITKNPDQASYDVNTVVELTAIPATGYHFTGWSGDLTGSANPVNVTMNANKSIIANFAINTYTLVVTSVNGTVAKNPNQAAYDSNTTVQLTATPATGYHFTSWSGDVTGTTNPVTVTMDANKNITANFAINTYTLTMNAANGSVAQNPNLAAYDSNSTVQLTATPATGYQFIGWSGDLSGSANPVTVTMNANKNITANFAMKAFTLTINAANGTVAKNPNLSAYDSSTTVQLTATPATGYHFTSWSGDVTARRIL